MSKQKDIFLESEADAWTDRNLAALESRPITEAHPVMEAMSGIVASGMLPDKPRVLEIGCGEGARLSWMAKHWQAQVSGIDPSQKAVTLARGKGVHAVRGTADELPFADKHYDVVIFGFCLYLCDREDLSTIAAEADRVLKPQAWIIIHDFFAIQEICCPYHHKAGVNTYKMDYRKLFENYPAYTCFFHKILHHENQQFTDASQDWVATSLLRKNAAA